jgi:hypothetical protein
MLEALPDRLDESSDGRGVGIAGPEKQKRWMPGGTYLTNTRG